jgi:hypothetical protein
LLLVWPWLCSPQCRMPKLKVRWWRKYPPRFFLFYSFIAIRISCCWTPEKPKKNYNR